MVQRGYGEDWGLAGKQAFWADMGRHSELIWAGIPYCVLHTCVRSVAPMELFFLTSSLKIIKNHKLLINKLL
ncbi:MAG: hypothetical protein IJE47_03675 [Bacteroidales bacterium]|nr:hypothetical protein [Bacteroidales bacterium]